MITPIHVNFSAEGKANFQVYLQQNLRPVIRGLRDIHETKLPLWRRIYEGQPLENVRHFPFENASNLVVPLAAIHADTLQARIMAAVFKLRPIWMMQLAGDFEGEGHAMRALCENYLTDLALEPEELDLYRVYRDFLGDVVKYGTSALIVPWETLIEASAVPAGDGNGAYELIDDVVYDGPRPERILFEDLFVSAQTTTLKTAHFKAHRKRLTYNDLMLRKQRGIYDPLGIQTILSAPNRSGPTVPQREQETKAGAVTQMDATNREWDIYECWCLYNHNGHNARLIATYHESTDTLLRVVFSFFPEDPWVGARLFPRDGMYHGYGLAEKLSVMQEEISKQHNERRDAQTVAHAKVWRVSPNSGLMDGFDIYPNAKVPAEKDDLEAMSHGEPLTNVAVEDEYLTLDLAERLSGVSPPQQGYGATQSKKGAYSAMGTLSLLQEGNTRTDLHISDIRSAHISLGRIVAMQIAHLGLDKQRFQAYGIAAEQLLTAFTAIKQRKMYLPVLASTAALNREIEKQSDILLVGIMMKHYQAIASIIAQASNQMLQPEVRDYLLKTVKAANTLMVSVLRHFDVNEPSRLVPEVDIESLRGGQAAGGGALAPGAGGEAVPGVGGESAGPLAAPPGRIQ
jgi:hypothetical protein